MPEHAIKFQYQLGVWGPIASTTTERYFAGGETMYWLWQKPDRYCDVCDGGFADWSVINFDTDSAYVEQYTFGGEGGTSYSSDVYYEDYYMDSGYYETSYSYSTTTEVVSYSYSEVYYEEPVLEYTGEEMVGGDFNEI
jgi:hypothetical protein